MAALSLHGRGGREHGNALVEFALVLPLLLLVFAGIVDFGLLFQRLEVLTNAAREGARIAVLPAAYGDAAVQQRVREYLVAGLGSVPPEFSVTRTVVPVTPPAPGRQYNVVRVTASFRSDYIILGPIVSLFQGSWGPSITLTATTTMRSEAQ